MDYNLNADYEEQMDLFFVRKDTNQLSETTAERRKCKRVNYPKSVFKCIPLMCKYLKAINEKGKDSDVFKIFSDTVQFTHCMVYGKIISKEKEYKSYYKYMLDDGTAAINIKIFKRQDDIDIIHKLENELEASRKELFAQNINEIVQSLRNLLFKAKEQTANVDLHIGSTIIVYGKPMWWRREVILNVSCFSQDISLNSDIEISFKDYLINWHRNNRILPNS